MTALFVGGGDTWTATELARGPWDPQHCHGGPVSALLARAVEQAAAETDDWQVARLTIELTRPVPVGVPVTLRTRVERPGRKVSLVAAEMSDRDGAVVAVARALRIRRADLPLPDDANRAVDDLDGSPADGRAERVTWQADPGTVAFHSHGAEHRFVAGSWAMPGPVQVWIRLRVPVIEGETPSGVQRVMAAADFGNGVSGALPADRFVYINPDLTVHLLRPPQGEWVGMRTESWYGRQGAGMAESALFDTSGRLGRSCQSLFVDAR